MKNNYFYIILTAIAVIATACTVSGTLNDDVNLAPVMNDEIHMTLTTTKSGEVTIEVAGSGYIVINWGNGTTTGPHNISGVSSFFAHSYSGTNTHTITITGDNIVRVGCSDNQITGIDVSKINTLTHLFCSNNDMTGTLDLSNNNILETVLCYSNKLTGLKVNSDVLAIVNCSYNNLNAENLSELLLSLQRNDSVEEKIVIIHDNPGADASQNKDQARNRGWEVVD